MKIGASLLSLALICSCSSVGRAQNDNLIVNGDLAQSPSRTTPGTENHAAAYKVPVPMGSELLPGWTVTRGKVWAELWKRGRKNLCLDRGGAVSQTVSTLPGRKYTLQFAASFDPEGPPEQKVLATCGSKQTEFDAHAKQYSTLDFVADSATTRIELVGISKGLGPLVWAISVRENNPAVQAIHAITGKLYRDLDQALVDPGGRAGLTLLTDDFTSTNDAGEKLDRSGWLDGFQKLTDKSPLVSSTVATSHPAADGSFVVYVKRRISYNGGGTQRTVLQLTLREVWVNDHDTWKLKSSATDK